MTKLIYILPAAVIMFCALYGGAISVGLTQNPFKVTDPSDPRFDPQQFRFEDYGNEGELLDALNKFFPAGTKTDRIKHILVTYANACYSERVTADKLSLSNNRVADPVWNNQNYLIEYMQQRGGDSDIWRAHVLFLFDGDTDGLLAIKANFVGVIPLSQSILSGANYRRWAPFEKTCLKKN